ncbi:MAG: DNA repair protein RadC [Pararobbsia sp.]
MNAIISRQTAHSGQTGAWPAGLALPSDATGLAAPQRAPDARLRSRARRPAAKRPTTFAGFSAARADMPRERLATLGAQGLSDSQLLAIFLGTGVAGKSATALGETLLERFGSLRGVLNAAPAALRQIRGIGPAKMSLLQAIGAAAQRALAEEMRAGPAALTPETVADFMRLWIGGRTHEVFVCLYLDAQNRLLNREECSRGTLTRTAVYPRELARNALDWNAASVIIGHNHPSGDPEPSPADRTLTCELQKTLATIEVQLLDHLVVSQDAVVSFCARGWLK